MAHICHGKNIANLGQALLQTSYKPELLSKKPRGSNSETCSPCGRNVITASFRLVFSSTGTWNNGRFMLNFEIIQDSFDLFYSLIEFCRHLMSIIQIWTTNTCSSSPKWLEILYMHVSLGACLGPMPGMGTNYNRTGVMARPQTFGILVFKST